MQAGFIHAKTDKENRALIETKVEAEREILALQSALSEFGQLLDTKEQKALQEKIALVQDAINGQDKTMLNQAILALKPLSDNFASIIMNQNIKQALAGTKASDW